MNYKKYIALKRVCILETQNKAEAITKLVGLIDVPDAPIDKDELLEKLFHREKVMSTGIGLGIGLPHIRFDNITQPIITIGLNPAGITDYKSIDNSLVRLVIMIIVSEGKHREYLELLAEIVKVLQKEGVLDRIFACTSPEEIFKIFMEQ